MDIVHLNSGIHIGNHLPFVVFGGLNVLENEEITRQTCIHFKEVCTKLGLDFVFKASFDKANRTSIDSFRGVGIAKAIDIFSLIKKEFNIPIMTDIHEPYQAKIMAQYCDFLQLPAFLARQTDLVQALAETDCVINIKKPQYLAPNDTQFIVAKFNSFGNKKLMICERGTSFGYHNLIVDFLGFETMKKFAPLIFDATHCLQTPTSKKNKAGGRGELINSLAKAAIVQKIAGIFIETHPNPKLAKCDPECALPLEKLEHFLSELKELDKMVKQNS